MKLTAIVGTILNVRVAFTDPDNGDEPFDPSTVSLSMQTPAGTITDMTYGDDAEVEKESEGHYLFRLTLVEEGTYRWMWSGLSPTKAVVVKGLADSEGGLV